MLAVLLVTELVVIVYVLSLSPLGSYRWETLALLSLYAQWVALLSAAGLCRLRPLLNRQSSAIAALICFCWILVVTVVANVAAQWIAPSSPMNGFSLSWLLRDVIIVAVLAAISLRYLYIQQGLRVEQRASHKANIDALHARIRPHFLFNSMNTIASLISYAPEEAEKSVEDLAAMFRAALSQNDVLVDWQHERGICEAYLRLEKQRLGARLNISWQIDALPENFQLPPLSVQPLIENAIYHGIERITDGGTLAINAQLYDGLVTITIENPLASDMDLLVNSHADDNNGMAVENIRARLAAIYKLPDDASPTLFHSVAQAGLKLSSDADVYTAKLLLPTARLRVDS